MNHRNTGRWADRLVMIICAAVIAAVIAVDIAATVITASAATLPIAGYSAQITRQVIENATLPTAGISAQVTEWLADEPESVENDIPAVSEPLEASVMSDESTEIEEDIEPMGAEVDDDEMYLLARLIYAEAGSIRDDECLYAVGSVVLNRMADPDYPDTMWGVIYQTSPTLQYQCTGDGHINWEPDERCLEIAEDLLRFGSTIPADVVYQSEFPQGSGAWKRFGNVVFSYK
ncbi:MAG: cell wall hydrolase [Clostridiales bacterium]|nr:cell wall hydrolase [Clostridiales bacterium]